MDNSIVYEMTEAAYAGRITLELIETVFLEEDNSAVFERLDCLRDLGVSLEVDNFGSGRASIVGLRRVAPDFLKIDHRLIEPVTTSESAGRLVGSIVEIGGALDIAVSAVGVKTAAHFEMIKRLGCTRAQGAYFYQPGALAEVCPLTDENVMRRFG